MQQEIHDKAENIRDVIRYIRRFKNASVVIHIQDEVITSPLYSSHIQDIALICEAGLRVVIIPGARRRIDEILSFYDVSWKMENGYRVTGEEAMPLIKMAAFDVSNQIMTSLAAENRTAVIGNWVKARGLGVRAGVDYGTSGYIEKIQVDTVRQVLDDGFIPIFPCIGWSAVGKPYNISSVKLAAEIAVRIKADKLFFLTDGLTVTPAQFNIPDGVGLSPEDCVPAMNLDELAEFLAVNPSNPGNEKTLELLSVSSSACSSGVSRVHILNGLRDGTIPCEIFSGLGSGTMIYKKDYGGLRPMTRGDIPSVLTLINPFVEKGILLPRSAEQLAEQYEDFIVYELDGGIRACAALHVYPDNQGEIAAVAVDPGCAHMGIGPKLLAYLIDRAKLRRLSCVFVLTTQTSDWFEQQGFTGAQIETLPAQRRAEWNPSRGSRLLRLMLTE